MSHTVDDSQLLKRQLAGWRRYRSLRTDQSQRELLDNLPPRNFSPRLALIQSAPIQKSA